LGAVEQVLDSAPWKSQRFILAGNSMGAWIAMLYANKHPERVSRLLLIDGGALKYEHAFTMLTPKTREEARRAFDAVLDPASPRPPAFVLDDLVRVTNRGTIARLMAAEAEIPDYILDGKLGDFPVPVDIVWGASDRLVPLDYARRLEAQLPAARLTIIEHCGHAPQIECPGKLLQALGTLLAKQPPNSKPESKAHP
jgi:pimeloyl-ACP methyl ester carboxylesterase